MLTDELTYYQEHLSDWLTRIPGKFVVVKNQEFVGAFDTAAEALAEGARRFGLTSFLVRRVEAVQAEAEVPALTLGLLSANPQRPVHRAGASR